PQAADDAALGTAGPFRPPGDLGDDDLAGGGAGGVLGRDDHIEIQAWVRRGDEGEVPAPLQAADHPPVGPFQYPYDLALGPLAWPERLRTRAMTRSWWTAEPKRSGGMKTSGMSSRSGITKPKPRRFRWSRPTTRFMRSGTP